MNNPLKKYCDERQQDPRKFDPRSFRTIKLGKKGKLGTVGCPKGEWQPRKKRCRVGMQLQRILIPEGQGRCRVGGKSLKRVKSNPHQGLWYVGIDHTNVMRIFRSKQSPSRETHGKRYQYVIGPHSRMDQALRSAKSLEQRGYALCGNPVKSAQEIYGRILAIEAQKGNMSLWPKQVFRHDFKKSGTKIIGLPDGSLLIKGPHRLWKNFTYSKADVEAAE